MLHQSRVPATGPGLGRVLRPGQRRAGGTAGRLADLATADSPTKIQCRSLTLVQAASAVRAFAELIGMNPNSISNYARTGDVPTYLALIAVLVVGTSEIGGDYRRIMSRVERVRKQPRGSARRGPFSAAAGKRS